LLPLHLRNDCRAAIEAAANPNVQPPGGRMFSGELRQALRCFGRRSECKPRRSPGALPDAVRAGGIETGKDAGNSRAREGASALRPREIIAKSCLQFFDGGAEADNIVLGEGRECLHQNQPTNPCRIGLRHRRKIGEGRDLIDAMHAATLPIEDNEDAPMLRKRQVTDDRSYSRLTAVTAIDNQAAAMK